MTTEPLETGAPHMTAERQQAVWPWMLVPLVALALFFALHRLRSGPEPPPSGAAAMESPEEREAR